MFEILGSFLPSNLFVVILVVLVCLFLTREYQKNWGVPPGPKGLPWIGYAFFLDHQRLSQQMADFCGQYKTDVLSVTSFGSKMVFLNTYDLVKEVFQKGTDAMDRLSLNAMAIIDPGYSGIIFTSGKAWKEARRFSISVLKDFGMGRVGAEEAIQNESKVLCDLIRKQNGVAFDPQNDINIAVANIICGMVFGRRFEHTDKDFSQALQGINDFVSRFSSTDPALFLSLHIKFLRDYVVKDRFQQLCDDYAKFSNFVKQRIMEHKNDYNGQTDDLIYCYLQEVENGKNLDVFDDKMLESLIVDYFVAGSETSYNTLRWGLLAMAAHPEIQKKAQEELDEVIGERTPSMSDKKQTPYTEAVLSEVQRHFTLAPLGAVHSNLGGDIHIGGYKIPQGSAIVPNLNQIHHDEKTWKNPDHFDPENFWNDGKVCNLDKLVPFSIGRRSCAGEALARMEVYVFFASLVKNFEIKLETDDSQPDLVGVNYSVYQPKPFKVRMKARC